MTQRERLIYLVEYLKNEDTRYKNTPTPDDGDELFAMFRSLVNVRMPDPIGEDFLAVQDEYLRNEISVVGIDSLDFADDIALWRGDITTLRCDAIVNAANNALLGCFCPCHACIDNCIHTFAGVQLRLKCNEIMQAQGHREKTGDAKITPAYNLPSKYVIHTVGPIISGAVTDRDEELLAECYTSCLRVADGAGLGSIAFCCISTGEFHFPNRRAAEIAIDTVREYKRATNSRIKVIFNVFKSKDNEIYKELLGLNQ